MQWSLGKSDVTERSTRAAAAGVINYQCSHLWCIWSSSGYPCMTTACRLLSSWTDVPLGFQPATHSSECLLSASVYHPSESCHELQCRMHEKLSTVPRQWSYWIDASNLPNIYIQLTKKTSRSTNFCYSGAQLNSKIAIKLSVLYLMSAPCRIFSELQIFWFG